MSLKLFLIFSVHLFSLCLTVAEKHINDSCTLSTNKQGQCLLLKDCPSALEVIKLNEKPVQCGFQGTVPIVCCEPKVGFKCSLRCNTTYSNLGVLFNIDKPVTTLPSEFDGQPVLSIVGGKNSPAKIHSHMAVLGYGEKDDVNWACGGTLISDKFVLTAAHCIKSVALNTVKFVRLGDLNLKKTDDDAKPQDFTVKRTIVHPGYKPPSAYHDIALIELDGTIVEDDYVRPACLHVSREIEDPFWLAIGWGTTSFGGETAEHLQVVKLKEYTHKDCKEIYETTSKRKLKNGIDDETQVCAGELNKDTCQGDSGGPLQVRNKFLRGYEIIGVTSFGKSCGIGSIPGVYTRVSHYISWIESIVFADS